MVWAGLVSGSLASGVAR